VRPLVLVLLLSAAARAEDRGIYPELSAKVERDLELAPVAGGTELRVDRARGLATLYASADPLKVYHFPLDERAVREVGHAPVRDAAPGRDEDRDGDGIVDRLDALRGGKKLLYNRAGYHEAYRTLRYPDGDVPRTEGVCTDTIIRALRNAGIDLQREVHEDIVASRASYPMVDKIDASINHRRVKTLVRWFQRHYAALPTDRDFQPGDVVFLDTFPARDGPEHVGLVSNAPRDGTPLVINNWTDGYVDSEMALLGAVGVTDHFRLDARRAAARSRRGRRP